MNEVDKISTICAWCKTWLYREHEEITDGDPDVSHGVCVTCFDKLEAEMAEDTDR